MACDGTLVLTSAVAKHVQNESLVESACKILVYVANNGTQSAAHSIHASAEIWKHGRVVSMWFAWFGMSVDQPLMMVLTACIGWSKVVLSQTRRLVPAALAAHSDNESIVTSCRRLQARPPISISCSFGWISMVVLALAVAVTQQ